jgi:hypothetical protein
MADAARGSAVHVAALKAIAGLRFICTGDGEAMLCLGLGFSLNAHPSQRLF